MKDMIDQNVERFLFGAVGTNDPEARVYRYVLSWQNMIQ